MKINYITTDAEKIFQDALSTIENELGEKLDEGDEKKIFLKSLMPILVGIANKINDVANQNLLENSRGTNLDSLALNFYSTNRLQPTYSFCKGIVKLSKQQEEDILIKAGTKITPDGIAIFKVKEDVTISRGELEKDLVLIATSTGSKYNGYRIGEINYLIDPIPYVEKIYNTEISASGADIEDDKTYRERARLEIESKSTTGSEGAYEYFAYTADPSITGVKVITPAPGIVKILVVVDNGEIPSQEILDKVYTECSARDRRPLTDKVEVGTPNVKKYDIELTYFLDKNFATKEGKWRKEIEGEKLDCKQGAINNFIKWQQEEVGKSINPDELRYKIQDAASYEVDGRKISGVRRIILTYPEYAVIEENELAKVENIKITYGGME